MNTSAVGPLLVEKRRFNVIIEVPSKNWRNNISVEKLQHIWRNSLRDDSVYQKSFLMMCGERWRVKVLLSSISVVLRKRQEFILLFEWLPVGDDLVTAMPQTVLTRIFKFLRPLWMICSRNFASF